MALTLTLPTTPDVEARLEKYRNFINVSRLDNGQTAYATVEDMLVGILKQEYPGWLLQMFSAEAKILAHAYVTGTDAQQTQAKAIYGL